jgi:hypothetical protein
MILGEDNGQLRMVHATIRTHCSGLDPYLQKFQQGFANIVQQLVNLIHLECCNRKQCILHR